MLKKIIAVLLLVTVLLTVTACGKKVDTDEEASVVGRGESANDSGTTVVEGGAEADAEMPKGEGSYSENKSNSILSTGDYAISEDYVIQGTVTNDNGFIPDENPQYQTVTENVFTKTAEQTTSTFAADVDTASYATLRNAIKGNMDIPPQSIRVEEMINYFSYDYKAPEGDIPFSVQTEIMDSPWSDNKLIRFGLGTKAPDYSEFADSNLVFLIDVSGSMDAANKLPLVKRAFAMLTENMGKKDKISIVTYASQDKIVIEGAGADKSFEIQTAIENLTAGGSTYGESGIITAYRLAEKYFIKDGNNRVILATDGDLNVGVSDTNELVKLIKQKKQSGIYLSVMGFGTDNLMDDKLESIADNGNGNYSYIDSVTEAKKVLCEEFGGTLFTVAKDVKLQVEFDKDVIEEYRLIGYENRTMANEDFDDDTKDGGEIGAGHRVTAIYEVKVKDEGKQEWGTLSVRHKKPDGDKSELSEYAFGSENYAKEPSEDTLFAVSVAQFGMLMRKSENVKGSYSDILSRISPLECVKNDEYKAEFLTFVQKYAGE